MTSFYYTLYEVADMSFLRDITRV